MDKFDIIGQLYRKAKANGWAFVAGDKYYQNASIINTPLNDGQLVMIATFVSATPKYVNGRTTEISYEGLLFLGRKFDNDGTASNLDELYIEKDVNRLVELRQLLSLFIAQFECENGITINNHSIRDDINSGDECVDFVGGEISITQICQR